MIRFVLFALLLPVSGLGQTVLQGVIADKSGNTIPGVNVWITNTYDGGTTDPKGRFNFTTSSDSTLEIQASAVGFITARQIITRSSKEIEITLYEKVNELNAVSITAGSIEVSDKATSVVLKPLDIYTTAGAIGDITGAFNTLPGTMTVANDGRLFVRGGDATETAIFFDGLRVGNAYNTTGANVPTRNRFNPNLFKGTFFSTGGYSAEFGDALSSILSLESIDKPVRNQTDISLMSVGGGVASTFVGKNQSLTAEVNVLDLTPYQELIKQDIDFEQAPKGFSAQAVYRHNWGKDGLVKGFLQGSRNSLIIWNKLPGDDSRGQRTAIQNDFAFGNTSYKKMMAEKWLAEGGFSISSNTDKVAIDSNNYEIDEQLIHVKQKFTYYASDALKLRTGVELFAQTYDERIVASQLERGFNDTRVSVFTEGEYFAGNDFTFRAGFRSTAFGKANLVNLEPRLAAAYRPYKEGTISLAAGMFSQTQSADFTVLNDDILPSQSKHLQLSFQHSDGNRTLRAEGYLKSYDRLALANGTTDGEGYAHGFDVFYRDRGSIANLDFWVTYSFVQSRRQFGSFTTQVQPSYAPAHNISVVGKYWVEQWKTLFGATWAMNSGFSYDDLNRPGEMESITPAFASLSLNASYLIRQNLILHVACNNVLGRDNVFGYDYSSATDENGQFQSISRGQVAKRFAFVAIFWTISTDKKANQLNNL